MKSVFNFQIIKINEVTNIILKITSILVTKTNKKMQGKNNNNKNSSKSNNLNHLPNNIEKYLLEDYGFLNEYQLLDSPINGENQFLAKIKDTSQLVIFIKRQFLPVNTSKGLSMYKRFETMFSLFQRGIILADNMFILQEGKDQYFYYIIEPYLINSNPDASFITLQQYLYENRQSLISFESRKILFLKCKNLLDNLSSLNEGYNGLNSKSIVIDDQGNVFLLPFRLQPQLINKPYQRSYYSQQVLQILKQSSRQSIKPLQKWDIWSFGCITAQIFLYLTPYYMSTSLQKQIQKIKKGTTQLIKEFKLQFLQNQQNIKPLIFESDCSIQQHLINQIQEVNKIINFLLHSLNQNESKRMISFQKIQQNQKQQEIDSNYKTSRSRRSIQKMLSKRNSVAQVKSNIIAQSVQQKLQYQSAKQQCSLISPIEKDLVFKQINIFQANTKQNQQNMCTFELRFVLFKIQSNLVHKQNQIKFDVVFSNRQRFQFYADLKITNQNQNQFQELKQQFNYINKKITFHNRSTEFIENLLQDEIQIIVSLQNHKSQKLKNQKSHIFINLSSLTIKNQNGLRIWKKPIKGIYQNENNDILRCKIKIQAAILRNKEQEIQERCQQSNTKTIKQSQTIKNSHKYQQFQIYQDQHSQNHNQTNSKSILKSTNEQKSTLKDNTQEEQKNKFSNILPSNFSSACSRKSSISKFSSINNQLDEISNFWKHKLDVVQNQDIKCLKDITQKSNLHKKVQFLSKQDQKYRNKNSKQNKSNPRVCKDLSNRLKNLLIN